jgi:ACS family glucarate transporter-like MFS transporter
MQDKRRYIVYLLLFLFLSIYSLDRAMMGVVGSTIAKEMQLSPSALGYLFSSYLWLYAITLLPAGAITDRVGAQRMCTIAAGGWSIFQALGGFATGMAMLLVTRLGLGVFESAANPCAHSAIREWTPRTERGFVTSIWYAGTNAGPAMGTPLVAWLTTVYGWRSAFFVTGILGAIWVLVWMAVYRSPDRATWLSETERTKILNERDKAPEVVTTDAIGYQGLLTQTPTLWGLALTQGCINYTSYFFLAWLPGFLQSSYHLTVMQAGGYTAIPFALSIFLSIGLSFLCDRLLSPQALRDGKRRYAVAIGAILSIPIVLTPYAGSVALATVILTIALTFNTFAQSMNFAYANDRLRSPADVGRTYAFFTLGGISFGIAGPIVTGYLVQAMGDFKVALVLCGALSVIATLATLTLTLRPLGERQRA